MYLISENMTKKTITTILNKENTRSIWLEDLFYGYSYRIDKKSKTLYKKGELFAEVKYWN